MSQRDNDLAIQIFSLPLRSMRPKREFFFILNPTNSGAH